MAVQHLLAEHRIVLDGVENADLVAVNKADRRGAEDATRMVKKQVARSRREPAPAVVATCAHRAARVPRDRRYRGEDHERALRRPLPDAQAARDALVEQVNALYGL